MPRLRFIDFCTGRGPSLLGLCNDNRAQLSQYVNAAQQRLVKAPEAGDEGWWGTWVEVAFNNVSRNNPYVTCPRSIARLEKINVCQQSTRIHNQFYEYLDWGNGRMPKQCDTDNWYTCTSQIFTRNIAITWTEQTIKPCYIRVYAADPTADSNANKHVLIQGTDNNGLVVRSQVVEQQVDGDYMVLGSPFIQSAYLWNSITGIQKDPTQGNINIMQVDPDTDDETLLLTMEPSETVAGYRRYYFNNLPANCCATSGTTQNVTVTAIAKMEILPVVVDTDYLVLQNEEAIIEECMAIRLSGMDNVESQQIAKSHHKEAVRLLNSELIHYLGKNDPAVNFAPFGSARLERLNISMR